FHRDRGQDIPGDQRAEVFAAPYTPVRRRAARPNTAGCAPNGELSGKDLEHGPEPPGQFPPPVRYHRECDVQHSLWLDLHPDEPHGNPQVGGAARGSGVNRLVFAEHLRLTPPSAFTTFDSRTF